MIDTTDHDSWVYEGGDDECLWTEADSDALDAEILRQREVNGQYLPRDPIGRGTRPDACVVCSHPLRSQTAPPDGKTRRHQGRGMCARCYVHDMNGTTPPPPRAEFCRACSVPLRTKSMHADGVNRMHYGRGLCVPCHRKGVE